MAKKQAIAPDQKKVYGEHIPNGRTVEEAAKERIRHAYSISDHQVVCFSGGKDSTILLNLVVEVAKELGRLPVPVLFADEEAIPQDTVDYVDRIRKRPELDLIWSCVPLKHRNSCSRRHPWWITWNPEERDKWCRPMPEWAISSEDRPDIPLGDIPSQMGYWYPPGLGTVVQFLGRRAEESATRWRVISSRRGFEAYISKHPTDNWPHLRTADPIYDFRTEDVWTLMHEKEWDYNPAYNTLARIGLSPIGARVAPPFGEEPSRVLWMFKRAWPELWDKMQNRVPGADCGARYSTTALYQYREIQDPAPGESWRDYATRLLMLWPEGTRKKVAANIAKMIRYHREKCLKMFGRVQPIPEKDKHPKTGVSWKEIAKVAGRGVLKGRTLAGIMGYKGKHEPRKGSQA